MPSRRKHPDSQRSTSSSPLADPQDQAAASPGERELAQEDAALQRKGEREADEPMPLHVYGESAGDHQRRHARTWHDMPANPPKGEEGGTAYQPDTSWVKEQ